MTLKRQTVRPSFIESATGSWCGCNPSIAGMMSNVKHLAFFLGLVAIARTCSSFVIFRRRTPIELLGSKEPDVIVPSIETLQDLKEELIGFCLLSPKPEETKIQELVGRFEEIAENVGTNHSPGGQRTKV